MGVAWPSTLPQVPIRDGYNYEDQDGRVFTDMTQGPMRARRLYANTPRVFSVTFLMTSAQLSAFESFWLASLSGGALAVDLPIQGAGGVSTREVIITTRDPQRSNGGAHWLVSFKAVSTS